jgi:ABC-type phosphate transport system substrate-binding protein
MCQPIPRRGRVGAIAVLGFFVIQLLAAGLCADAEGFTVIVNAANPASSITRSELSRIFLKKTGQWPDGTRALPVDLGAASPVRASFSRDVHGRNAGAVKAYWQKMIFSGREIPPAELASAAEVIAFVAANRGAVGYVAAGASPGEGVKAIRVVP